MAAEPRPSVPWEPSQYAFDPYRLTAEKYSPIADDWPADSRRDGGDSVGGEDGFAAADAASSPQAVKRRPGRQKLTSVLCQVPGCHEELVDAKKYYRRYRICATHRNIACLVIEGRRQRFCQQCGRFHEIGEFEGAKRSCKRKLKQHNARRRNPNNDGDSRAAALKTLLPSSSEEDMEYVFAASSGAAEGRPTPAVGAKQRATRRQRGVATPAGTSPIANGTSASPPASLVASLTASLAWQQLAGIDHAGAGSGGASQHPDAASAQPPDPLPSPLSMAVLQLSGADLAPRSRSRSPIAPRRVSPLPPCPATQATTTGSGSGSMDDSRWSHQAGDDTAVPSVLVQPQEAAPQQVGQPALPPLSASLEVPGGVCNEGHATAAAPPMQGPCNGVVVAHLLASQEAVQHLQYQPPQQQQHAVPHPSQDGGPMDPCPSSEPLCKETQLEQQQLLPQLSQPRLPSNQQQQQQQGGQCNGGGAPGGVSDIDFDAVLGDLLLEEGMSGMVPTVEPMEFGPSLSCLPPELLEDIPLIPLPAEMGGPLVNTSIDSRASSATAATHLGVVPGSTEAGDGTSFNAGAVKEAGRKDSGPPLFAVLGAGSFAVPSFVTGSATPGAPGGSGVGWGSTAGQLPPDDGRGLAACQQQQQLLVQPQTYHQQQLQVLQLQQQHQLLHFHHHKQLHHSHPPQLWQQQQQQQQQQQVFAPAASPLPALQGVSPAVLASAHSMLSTPSVLGAHSSGGGGVGWASGAPLVGYASAQQLDRVTTLSLKVFSCTPDRLLPAVRGELQRLLDVGDSLLEGNVRPGCTQLTLNALVTRDRMNVLKEAGLAALVTQMLHSGGGGGTCEGGNGGDGGDYGGALDLDMLVQFEGQLAVLKRRRLAALVNLERRPAVTPTLATPLPLAVACSGPAASTENLGRTGNTGIFSAAATLLLRGRHLCGEDDVVLARQQGSNLTAEMHGCGSVQGGEWARVRVLGLLPGCADLEVEHGSLLSAPRPLLVLPSAAAAGEVRQLELQYSGTACGIECVDDMLRDMGLVVQYLYRRELAAQGCSCPNYTPTLLTSIARKACSLVAVAIARRWAATAELLLPAVSAEGAPAAAAVATMDACCPSGSTILHVAVGTGSTAVLQVLAAWSAAAGHTWEVDATGAAGVTPLHLAALLPNAAAMRAALAAAAPATNKLWGLVQADDGITPKGLAEAAATALGAATPALAAAAGVRAAQPLDSACSSCGVGNSEGVNLPADGCTASGSKAAGGTVADGGVVLPADSLPPPGFKVGHKVEEGESHLPSSCQPSKVEEAEGRCPPGQSSRQRRRCREALKAHLGEMHMTSMISEVESELVTGAPRDPMPLANALSSTLAAGMALLRALHFRGDRQRTAHHT